MVEIKTADVLERFTLYSGLSSTGAAKYETLCASAAAEITRRERANCADTAQNTLCAAAAALAFYRKALMDSGGGAGSFSAGDVKVTESSANIPAAKELWREASAQAAQYLEDSGFMFGMIST